MADKIFINYRRDESLKDAQLLKAELDKKFGGKRVFLDVRGIDGGANWLQTVERQVAASAAMVVLIGMKWADFKDEHGNRRLDDPHDKVRFEISQAFLRNLPVIPVSVDGAPVPKVTQLPDNIMQLSHLQAMLLRTESFVSDSAAIAQRLKAMLVARRTRGVPTWAAGMAAGATLIAGIAAGPLVLTSLRLPLIGVTLPGDPQLRFEELKEARRQLEDARTTAKIAEERVTNAEKKEAMAEASLKSASERLAAVERERDRAQQDVASGNARIAILEGRLAANPLGVRAFRECSNCPEMVVVPAGSFTMGSPDSEKDRGADEGPQHTVTFTRPFAMGKFHVTVDQFAGFVAATGYDTGSKCRTREGGNVEERSERSWRNPGFAQAGSHPAVCLSWNDATAYVDWVARRTGKPYRLPSEAEWEYAARGRTAPGAYPPYSFGNEEKDLCRYGNGSDQTRKSMVPGTTGTIAPCTDGFVNTSPVGSFAANSFGLYDMQGNAGQRTADCYRGSYNGAPQDGSAWVTGDCNRRVVRGGSWYTSPNGLRAAARGGNIPFLNRGDVLSFRLARTLDP